MKKAIIFLILAVIIFAGCEQPSSDTTKSETSGDEVFVQYFQSNYMPYNGYDGASDTYITESAPENIYGTSEIMYVGFVLDGGLDIFSLLKFNLTSIPAQARITNAYLLITNATGKVGNLTINVHEVLGSDWAESSFRWSLWNTPNYSIGTLMGSFATVQEDEYRYSISLNSGVIQNWVTNSTENFGMVMKPSLNTYPGNINASFFTKEQGATYLRPMLVIYYTL